MTTKGSANSSILGSDDSSLTDMALYAQTKGVVLVVAAGNFGPLPGTMGTLAHLPGAISVGSADWDGKAVSSFSSRGWPRDPDSGPTVVAPGENVIVLLARGITKTESQRARDKELITQESVLRQCGVRFAHDEIREFRERYTVTSGTSNACAVVSGLCARFKELRTKLQLRYTLEDVMRFLELAARPIPGFGRHEQGFGFISNETVDTYFRSLSADDPFWTGC